MRRRPKPHNNKLSSVIKSRLSVIDGVKTCFTTRKPAKIPWSRRAKHQSRLKYRIMQPRRANSLLPAQIKSTARVMADLHIPFLEERSPKSVLSDESWLRKMRWSYEGPTWNEKRLIWKNPGYPRQDDLLLPRHEANGVPHWNLPPTKQPDAAIFQFTIHLETKSWCPTQSHLQVPASWPIFDAVNWEQKYIFQLAITDSSDSKKEENRDYILSEDSEYDEEVLYEAVVHCDAGNLAQPRKRRQCELLKAMEPRKFVWRHQTDERARRRDEKRHAGNLDYNQTSLNQDIWPQTAITAFLSAQVLPPEQARDYPGPELPGIDMVGRLIINTVATDIFPSQRQAFIPHELRRRAYAICASQEIMEWPPLFARHPHIPIIDYTCRSRHVGFGLNPRFHPLLFAAQHSRGNLAQAIKQIAMAFQPMMTLFILYYLDQRISTDEPMPSWMVLFGAVYNDQGFYLQAYYPSFCPPVQTQPGEGWGWGARVDTLSANATQVLSTAPPRRGHAIMELSRIQGHCRHVLENLSSWDGYERAYERLTA